MKKQQAIDMIPWLKGTESYIEASDKDGNVLVFPRLSGGFNNGGNRELKDIMVYLIQSNDNLNEIGNDGFALWLDVIIAGEQRPVYKYEWIYFRKGEIRKDRVDGDKEKRLVDKKLQRLENQNRGMSELESRREGEWERGRNKLDNEKQEEPVNIQYADSLNMDLVEQFLGQHKLHITGFENPKRKLSYLVEFSLIDDSEWDNEKGIAKFFGFLRQKRFENKEIIEIVKLSNIFFDWLKEQKQVSYNPIKIYRWKLKEKLGK